MSSAGAADVSALSVVLRLSAKTLDLDALLTSFPKLKPDAVWRRGEAGRRQRAHETSGLNLTLVEGARWPEVWNETRRRLGLLREALSEAVSAGAQAELDVGVFADEGAFNRVVALSGDDLQFLSALGIEFAVSVYGVPSTVEDSSQ